MKNKSVIFGLTVVALVAVTTASFAQLFTRVTTGPIVTYNSPSRGGAWGDFDNDGDLDLFVANALRQSNNLYTNEGNGFFTKVRIGEIVSLVGDSFSPSWADLDNDGDLDLIVANGGLNGKKANYHFINDGAPDFTFSRNNDGALVFHSASSHNSCLGDFNSDGRLDVFFANDFGERNFLFTNNLDGTFARMSTGAIATDTHNSLSGNWVDYDDDGDLDLFVVNFDDNNVLYANNGNGSFTKITSGVLVNDKLASSVGASWGDFDNDGDLDVFVANAEKEKNLLYLNNGEGAFTKINSGPIVEDDGNSQGSGWADFDNDGDLDLFVANSDRRNALYENNGDGTFARVPSWPPDTEPARSAGVAWADLDNDGDLDLFVANLFEKNALYINNANGNNWINVRCVGTFSNRTAIGTKIRVNAVINGRSVWQLRETTSITGAYGQSSLRAHFGLGDAQVIEKIRVEWPSGNVDEFHNVAVNKFFVVVEDKNMFEDTRTIVTSSGRANDALPEGFELQQNLPNPFNPTTTIRYNIPELQNSSMVKLTIYNTLGQKIRTLVNEKQAAGVYSVKWDGKDSTGLQVASGVYVYRLRLDHFVQSKKMILLR
ncbi:MAG: FG-GAP-like repeat-containing protein [bacterium]